MGDNAMMGNEVTKSGVAILSLVLMLGACGSSGGGDGELVPLTSDELDEINEDMDRFAVRGETTPYPEIPTSGVVQYEGASFMRWELDGFETASIRGAVEISADFDNNHISGQINRIVDNNEDEFRPYQGVLEIEGLQVGDAASYEIGTGVQIGIDPGPLNVVGGTVTGVLTDVDGIVSEVDATVDADFRGANAEYLLGIMDGTVVTDGIERDILVGQFMVQNDTSILP
ncbi:hypothetical protein [Yoonia sp. 2307UL14-13]|uniref:hypothetical protein n=1 Tax=Yoonia sp. 2307UL14-13 TaxID=3126506 RepID=UPI0030A50563